MEDADRFEGHLDHLIRKTHPVSLEEVVAAIRARRTLPRRAVLITFDDARRDALEIAAPMLRERGLPGVACIVAGSLDTAEPFWWEEVEGLLPLNTTLPEFQSMGPRELVGALKILPDEQRIGAIDALRKADSTNVPRTPHLRREELPALESAGIAVANHSLSHPSLPRCPDEKVRSEIIAADEILRASVGHPLTAVTYPNGDWDRRVLATARDAGYEIGLLFDHRLAKLPPTDPLLVSRLRIDASASIDRLAITLSGLHPTLHRLRGGD
jgi:peptidoglycan/xylan/chitin deacetylase (PgdA/CDA1 family)